MKLIVGFVVSAVLWAGCSKSGLSTGQTTCSYGGRTYRSGATFASTDGCNNCSCASSGEVACTLMACLGDAGYLPPTDVAVMADMAPDSWLEPDTARSGDEVKPDISTPADIKLAIDAAGDAKTPADAASEAKSGTDTGNALCTLPTAVTFGANGGMVMYQDQYRLDPALGLTVTRNYNGRGSSGMDGATVRTCSPTLPACGAPAVVSLSTIVADLAAADVQSAFALGTTPIYGVDERPVDGTVWSISLASGGSVLVGAPCPSPSMSSCRPIPPGIQRLTQDLQSLATAMSAQSACAGL